MRTFVAVELEPALHEPLVRLLAESCPKDREVRWCMPNQLHVTLKFLGEVDDVKLAGACEVVRAVSAGLTPFPLRLTHLGCFPHPRAPRVLWCGLDDPAGGCQRWLASADPGLEALGFPREERSFTPHVTLGRSKGPGGGRVMQRVLNTPVAFPTTAMQVRQMIVFESLLLPAGAQYRPVCMAPLGAGEA